MIRLRSLCENCRCDNRAACLGCERQNPRHPVLDACRSWWRGAIVSCGAFMVHCGVLVGGMVASSATTPSWCCPPLLPSGTGPLPSGRVAGTAGVNPALYELAWPADEPPQANRLREMITIDEPADMAVAHTEHLGYLGDIEHVSTCRTAFHCRRCPVADLDHPFYPVGLWVPCEATACGHVAGFDGVPVIHVPGAPEMDHSGQEVFGRAIRPL